MISMITNGVSNAVAMGGSVITAILGSDGSWSAVQDVIGLQIGMAVIGWAIVKVKSLVYGF